MKTEFDVVKAILGYSFNIEDLSREELSIDEYGTEWTKQNKPKPIQDKKSDNTYCSRGRKFNATKSQYYVWISSRDGYFEEYC